MLASQEWLERGILAIDARQTADEKETRSTSHDNGKGWNKADAGFGASLAEFIRKSTRRPGERLTAKQVEAGHKMMRKYAGQLARCACGTVAKSSEPAVIAATPIPEPLGAIFVIDVAA
jgi:hypothetical protein